MYLLDTNVVSELRRRKPHGGVLAWIGAVEGSQLFISALSVGEIQAGIERTRAQGPALAEELGRWLDALCAAHQIIAPDARVFRTWARLMHRRSDTLIEDGLIAATALVHNLTVATRNVRDFAAFGVQTVNPFSAKPSQADPAD